MSNFFRNRAKNKNERLKKIKSRATPIKNSEKISRIKKEKIFSDEELKQQLGNTEVSELFSSLNEEQLEAATSSSPNTLVIASAGTGKTSTIVARVIHLLEQGIQPTEIMLITFTSKAAKEMVQRIKKYIQPEIANEILIGTFHATAIKLLKKNNLLANIKSPKVLKNIFSLAAHKYNFERYSNDIEHFYSISTLIQLYASFQAKGDGKKFDDWFKDEFPTRENHFDILHHYESIFNLYQEELEKENILGFNELLLKATQAKEIKTTFAEIIIDEYQDTSKMQMNYVKAINHKRLFCVGDYDQSIYAFNGADISIIGSFTKTYPNSSVINLKKNYRSQKPILDLAQKSISINERLYPKELQITKTDESTPVEVLKFNKQEDQYSEIAQRIADCKRAFTDIAILFRTNATATRMELALSELNIDSIRDDSSSFFEIDEVLYTINLLRLLRGSDKLALIDILNSLFGFLRYQ